MKLFKGLLRGGMFLLALAQATVFADSILLDDFSTNLTLSNVVFSALNSDGTVNPTGSTAGSVVSTFWNRIELAPGNMATWTDTVSPSFPNGILGGVRSGEIRNGTGSNQKSNFKILNGVMNVDSPSANMLCLTCLTYNFSTRQDFSIVSRLIVDFTTFDVSARGKVTMSVSLFDGVTTSSGDLTTTTVNAGLNYFWLTGTQNWGRLNMSQIQQVKVGFATNTPGVDFTVNSLAFTHAPEPNSLIVLGAITGISVVIRQFKNRRRRMLLVSHQQCG